MTSEPSESERKALIWALADDDNMSKLLLWHRVKVRAEAGGFNGVLASDYRYVREAFEALTVDMGAKDHDES